MATIICSFNNVPFRPDKIRCEGDLSSHEVLNKRILNILGVPAIDDLQAEVIVCYANIIRFFVGTFRQAIYKIKHTIA